MPQLDSTIYTHSINILFLTLNILLSTITYYILLCELNNNTRSSIV